MALAKPFRTLPLPLGALAPTPGTPLKLTNNFTDMDSDLAGIVTVRALATNIGNIYILNSSSAADLTNFLNVVDILAPGGFWNSASQGLNQMVPSKFFIDADNAPSKAVITIGER